MPAPGSCTVAVKVMACPTSVKAMLEFRATVVAVWAAAPASRMLWGTTPLPPNETEPLAPPTVNGRKAMFSVQLAPGARVIGEAGQLPPGAAVKGPLKLMVETA